MYMAVLNHTTSRGMGGFQEEAIVIDGEMPNGFNCLLEEVTGFRSTPNAARRASLGISPYHDDVGQVKTSEDIARFLSAERKRFLLPFNSIAYIEDLNEIGD